jgi:glycosyltransferase involved in cell wall biosynthesis
MAREDIEVCICTHNPDGGTFRVVLAALESQDSAPPFAVLVVDNASSPPIPETLLDGIAARGCRARIVRESQLGIAAARARAIRETQSEWILFVDDDNALATNYLRTGLEFARQNPDVGCFGGKLLLPASIKPAKWMLPFLPYLGIKDAGEEVLSGCKDEWAPWEPPTAGAWVRRDVLEVYEKRMGALGASAELGRKGRQGLGSCEDSLMMRGAARIGAKSAYVPKLVLFHHLSPHRLRLGYLLKLMRAYGPSHVALERALLGDVAVPTYYADPAEFRKMIWWVFRTEAKRSVPFAIAQVRYHFAARAAHLRA